MNEISPKKYVFIFEKKNVFYNIKEMCSHLKLKKRFQKKIIYKGEIQ